MTAITYLEFIAGNRHFRRSGLVNAAYATQRPADLRRNAGRGDVRQRIAEGRPLPPGLVRVMAVDAFHVFTGVVQVKGEGFIALVIIDKALYRMSIGRSVELAPDIRVRSITVTGEIAVGLFAGADRLDPEQVLPPLGAVR